jgi:hypothetical protein
MEGQNAGNDLIGRIVAAYPVPAGEAQEVTTDWNEGDEL